MKSLLMIAVLAAGLAAQGLVAPVLETFDAETSGGGGCVTVLSGTLPAGWANDATTPGGWQARATATTSFATGPSADFSGSGLYVYTETSGTCGTAGTPFILNLPTIDISGLSDPAVRFQAHLWGSAIGNLDVEAFNPLTSVWVTVGSLSGDRGNTWRQYEFSLLPVLTGSTIDLRFVHTVATGTGVTSFEGDAGLDEIEVADRIGVPPFFGDWQENSAEATVTLNGATVAGPTATEPANIGVCPTDTIAAVIDSTLVGLPWDIALDLPNGSAVSSSAGGLTIPAGIVNVNFASPTLTFLNGFTFTTPFPGTLNLPVPAAFFGRTAAVQGVWFNPASPTGFALSQATEVRNSDLTPALPAPGPTADDGTLLLSASCGASFTFFGQTFTDIGVNSNGRVTFGAIDGDFSATVAEALLDAPMFGYWTDLNPATAGSIDISSPTAGVYDIDWNGVAYFGEATTANTFKLQIDTNTGILSIDGLSGLQANPVSGGTPTTGDGYFLGLSAGNVGATDAGPSMFSVGSAGTGALPSDMLYESGQHMVGGPGLPAGVVSGTNTIQFIPTGGLGYTFITL